MAGLYDGLEEAAFFKRADGGYIYGSPNPWLFGPSVNYVVTEAEKAAIANRIRDTLRAVKPVVLAAMIVIPIFLIGVTTLVVLSGASSLHNLLVGVRCVRPLHRIDAPIQHAQVTASDRQFATHFGADCAPSDKGEIQRTRAP